MRVFLGIFVLILVIIFAPFGQAQEGTATVIPEATLNVEPRPINSVEWSPDGSMIAVAGGESGCSNEPIGEFAIYILSSSNQEVLGSFHSHHCTVSSLAWSPDGTMIASSSIDGTSKVWDVESGELIATSVTATLGRDDLAWNPVDTLIADVFMEDFRFEIWNPSTGGTVSIIENPGYNAGNNTLDIAWSPNGAKIISGGTNQRAYIWNIATSQILFTLSGHTEAISSVTWSPDGTKVATGSYDETIRLWDARTGILIHTIESGTIWGLAWHPSNQYLASVILDGDIRIWDIQTEQEVVAISSTAGRIGDIDWSPDGNFLAFGGSSSNGQDAELQIVPFELTEEAE
jgi:WD40 repeat protein